MSIGWIFVCVFIVAIVLAVWLPPPDMPGYDPDDYY